MLTDWTVPVFGIGQAFELEAVRSATANDVRRVHQFIDPSLRRVQLTWDDVAVPARLREVAEESWRALDGLADEGGDDATARAHLDELRTAYADLYEEAEALSQSTAVAARREGQARAAAAAPRAPRRAADRVPHRVRALVPAGVRRRLRRALGRER
jgi:NADH dehydrogenase/NADH:ubiquinone oxidoreductase subunit G